MATQPGRRSSDTRAKMLEVAEREFAREGYPGAHLQRIASQVGVQKTALYYYFPSKSALYQAVLDRILDAVGECVIAALSATERSHEERLVRLLDGLNDLLATHPTYSKILVRIYVDRIQVDEPQLRTKLERVLGPILYFLKDGMEAGVFVRRSSRHLLQTLVGSLVLHYASGEFGAGVLGVDDVFGARAIAWRRQELRRLLLRGVLKETPAEPRPAPASEALEESEASEGS